MREPRPENRMHKEMSGVRNWPSALAFNLFGDIWERKSGLTQVEVTSSLCWEGRRHWGVRTSPWPPWGGVRTKDKTSCQTQHGVRDLPHVSWKEDTAHTEKGLPREHPRMSSRPHRSRQVCELMKQRRRGAGKPAHVAGLGQKTTAAMRMVAHVLTGCRVTVLIASLPVPPAVSSKHRGKAWCH